MYIERREVIAHAKGPGPLAAQEAARPEAPRGTNGLPVLAARDNGGTEAVALGLSMGDGSQGDPINLCD